jgi:hypothetical protein
VEGIDGNVNEFEGFWVIFQYFVCLAIVFDILRIRMIQGKLK